MKRLFVLLSALTLLASAPLASAGSADAPIELGWKDLIPQGEMTAVEEFLRQSLGENSDGMLGMVPHGSISNPQSAAQLVSEYDGKTVKLPGYMVPLDYDGEGSKTFLLVPFVGACVHVPPPPPNQIVLVEADEPYPLKDYFEPVYVTGPFNRFQSETDLAEVGYLIKGRKVEPYEPTE